MKNEKVLINVLAAFLVALIVGGVIAADLAWNNHVYGDWRCAFAHCRRVVDR